MDGEGLERGMEMSNEGNARARGIEGERESQRVGMKAAVRGQASDVRSTSRVAMYLLFRSCT